MGVVVVWKHYFYLRNNTKTSIYGCQNRKKKNICRNIHVYVAVIFINTHITKVQLRQLRKVRHCVRVVCVMRPRGFFTNTVLTQIRFLKTRCRRKWYISTLYTRSFLFFELNKIHNTVPRVLSVTFLIPRICGYFFFYNFENATRLRQGLRATRYVCQKKNTSPACVWKTSAHLLCSLRYVGISLI